MRSAELVSPAEIVSSGLCVGCGACVAEAGGACARMSWDRNGQLKPSGPPEWLRRRTRDFSALCPSSPLAADEDELARAMFPGTQHGDPLIGHFEAAYVGHASEGDFRANGSSGGMVSWVAGELLRKGLVDGVAHVAPSDGDRLFRYRISRDLEALRRGAKSRYYPVEMSEVLAQIRAEPGRYAVVGIPCFIKAVNLLRARDPVIAERVAFTLGLYCGHMKSARMVESFAWQMGVAPAEVAALDYRVKDESRPANWYRAELRLRDGTARAQDWWHLADGDWGAGFFQNDACDFCDDVVAETADISFGDAWVEPYSSDGRGTNVVVVRSPALHALVEAGRREGRLSLEPVDRDFVVETQAAGFRHRREGLAWRLARRRSGVRPRKRVEAAAGGLTRRRRAVYFLRREIARWSNRIFRLARRLDRPALYLGWARLALRIYQAFAWSHGRLGRMIDRLERFEQSIGRANRAAR